MAEMFGNVAASHGALSEGGTASAGMSFPIIVPSDTGPPASFPLSPVSYVRSVCDQAIY